MSGKRSWNFDAVVRIIEGTKDIFNEPILVEIAEKYHKSCAQIALRYQ